MEESSTAYELGKALGPVFACVIFLILITGFVVSLIFAILKKSTLWIVSTVIFGLIGASLIIVPIVLGASSVAKEIEASKEPEVFVSEDGLVEITGPGAWSGVAIGSEDSSLEIGSLVREEYVMIINESKAEIGADFTLEDYVDILEEMMESVFAESGEDYEIGSREAVEIGGLPAYQLEMSGVIDGIAIAYANSYIESEGHYHQVVAWTLKSRAARSLPVLQEAARSFRVLGEAAE